MIADNYSQPTNIVIKIIPKATLKGFAIVRNGKIKPLIS